MTVPTDGPTTSGDVYRAFRVAYDGRAYHGFQRQPAVPTVDGALIDAFDGLGIDVLASDRGTYAAAGRTDAGVSALAQTIVAECPHWVTPSALNGELPEDIRVWAAADVETSFHPRHDAEERLYTYVLHARDLDIELARRVCAALEGTHDFRNLSAASGRSERTVTSCELLDEGEFATLTVRAPGFLHEQVRRMASLVRLIGGGERPPSFVDRVLDGAAIDGPDGIHPAPAERLVLLDVRYPSIHFDVDARARTHARRNFRDRSIALCGTGIALGRIATGLDVA